MNLRVGGRDGGERRESFTPNLPIIAIFVFFVNTGGRRT